MSDVRVHQLNTPIGEIEVLFITLLQDFLVSTVQEKRENVKKVTLNLEIR